MLSNYPSNKIKNTRAKYLLEFAVSLPVLLSLVLGANDINNVMRAKTALQEGSKTTLRCLYPTDGKCWQNSGDTRSRLYHAQRVNQSKILTIGTYNYDGEASWLEAPRYSYNNADVNIIGSVSYAVPNPQIIARWNSSNLELQGDVPYVVEEYSLPYISGNELNARYTTANNNEPYPEVRNVSVNNIAGITNRGSNDDDAILIGESSTFIIENPFVEKNSQGQITYVRPCFVANNVDTALNTSKNANFSTICKHPNSARIMLDISGDILSRYNNRNVNSSSQGKVLIELIVGNTTRKLGGRLFSANDSNPSLAGNFAPRGYLMNSNNALTRTSHSLDKMKYDEEALTHNNLTVPYDTPIKLRYKLLSKDSGLVAWRATQLRVFTSVYKKASDLADCTQKYSLSQVNNIASCPSLHPSGLPALKPRPKYEILPINQQVKTLPCGTTMKTARSVLSSDSSVRNPDEWEFSENKQPQCGTQSQTDLCPSNLGIDGVFQEGVRDLGNNPLAQAVCPINNKILSTLGISAINPNWREITKNETFTAVTHEPINCFDLNLPTNKIPSVISKYKKYRINPGSVDGSRKIYTRDISPEKPPSKLKQELAEYACSEFGVSNQKYSEDTKPALSANSVFRGIHTDLGCGWEEKLRLAAINETNDKLKLNPKAYFKGLSTLVGEKQIDSAPTDNCISFKQVVTGSKTIEDLGTMPEKDLPPDCKNHTSNCQISFVGFANDGQAGSSKYDSKIAIQTFGLPEIQSTIPQASLSTEPCKNDYCFNMTLTEDSTDSSIFQTKANMLVPTYFSKIFGKEHIIVAHQESERLEREFTK
jgi:hypothetical protein